MKTRKQATDESIIKKNKYLSTPSALSTKRAGGLPGNGHPSVSRRYGTHGYSLKTTFSFL